MNISSGTNLPMNLSVHISRECFGQTSVQQKFFVEKESIRVNLQETLKAQKSFSVEYLAQVQKFWASCHRAVAHIEQDRYSAKRKCEIDLVFFFLQHLLLSKLCCLNIIYLFTNYLHLMVSVSNIIITLFHLNVTHLKV